MPCECESVGKDWTLADECGPNPREFAHNKLRQGLRLARGT